MQKLKNKNIFSRVNYRRKYNKKTKRKLSFLKNFKIQLRKKIRNDHIFFTIPKFLRLYFFLKKWKKNKNLRFWRYYSSFKHIYFNKYRARSLEWKNFQVFKKDLNIWFQNRTKRQLYLLKKKFIFSKKGNKIQNYFRLKKKFPILYKKYILIKRRYFFLFKKLRLKFFFSLYLKILLNKRKNLLNKFLLFYNSNKYIFFKNLYNFMFLFKKLRIYIRKFFRKKFSYMDILDLKELKFIKEKWINKRKKRKKIIDKNLKFEKRVKIFFNLKRKISFFLNLPKVTNQFYYLKVKTVDTNFYVTLTNSKHEVIIYRSTGHVSENRKKKIKLSPFTINNMIYDIIKKIKSLKIQYIIVHINSKINKNIKNIFRTIGKSVNTKLIKAEFSKPIPHHFGTRKPKPRRL